MNFELRVKELSQETFILTGKINDGDIINNLINFVKNNKDENLSYKTKIKGHFTGFTSLVNNEDLNKFVNIIRPQIKLVYQNDFNVFEAWGNILKKDEEVLEHVHDINGFCVILYLTENGPGTFFKQHNFLVNEEIGKYVIFSPCLIHSVEKIKEDVDRITVAFNAINIKKWSD